MSETRRVDEFGNIESKTKKNYIAKTIRVCPTCGKDNLFVKIRLADSSVLECPKCDQTVVVPKGTENLPG
jgi:transposase-like protein